MENQITIYLNSGNFSEGFNSLTIQLNQTKKFTEKFRHKASPFMEKKGSESGAFRQDGMARFPRHIQSTKRAVVLLAHNFVNVERFELRLPKNLDIKPLHLWRKSGH